MQKDIVTVHSSRMSKGIAAEMRREIESRTERINEVLSSLRAWTFHIDGGRSRVIARSYYEGDTIELVEIQREGVSQYNVHTNGAVQNRFLDTDVNRTYARRIWEEAGYQVGPRP